MNKKKRRERRQQERLQVLAQLMVGLPQPQTVRFVELWLGPTGGPNVISIPVPEEGQRFSLPEHGFEVRFVPEVVKDDRRN